MIRLIKKFRAIDLVMFILVATFTVSQVYFDLKLPEYTQSIIQEMMNVGATTSSILKIGGKMLLICLGSILSTIVASTFATFVATNFSRRLRVEIFKKVESFSVEEISRFETSSLITRTTNDVIQVQMGYGMSMNIIISAPLTAIWALLKIKSTNVKLSLAVGSAIGSIILMIFIIFALVIPRFKKMQKLTDKLNDVSRENLTGIRVVRAYGAEKYEEEKFKKANDDLTHNNLVANRIMGLLFPSLSLVMSAISLIVYWLGSHLIVDAGLEYPSLTAFVSYSMQILMAFMSFALIMIVIPRANVSAGRILEVLDTKNMIEDAINPKDINEEELSLEFKDVSFTYPNGHKPVVDKLNFKVKKGETLAIIGATGSGKTTILNMIPRFIDTTQGEVIINGNNIREYSKTDLRDIIGYVPQKRFLFAGTIESNIKFNNPNLDNEKMIEAAHIAMADDFIENMPQKYESHIAQGGKNVSGGQMQRLCIARAVAKDPKIYMFDDSFSALDYKTDKEVRKRLKEHTKEAITIIVAQRIGTILDADKIIVLDKGEIVGMGRHDELLKTSEVYKEIALSQMTKEELGL